MRSMLFVALSAIATLVAARENPFNIPTNGYEFTAGESTTLNWDPTTEGTVTLKLQWGSAAFTSSTGTTIVSNIPNSGSYTWDVPSDITDHSDYTVEIISDSDPESSNYLPRFSVEGAEAATTTATSTTTTETTTTEETTTTTETSSTSTHTTLTTTTTTTTESSETPSPTPTSTSSETPAATTTTESSTTSTESTESPSDSPTSVPNVNDEGGDNAGMSNRVSGGLLALALGVAALV